MWPTRAPGTSSSTASSIPRPARSTGTTTTSGFTRRPAAGPSGVSTTTSVVGTALNASAASMTLMRVALRRKSSGSVRLSRRLTSASWTSGCVTVCSGTALHYTTADCDCGLTNAECGLRNREMPELESMRMKRFVFVVLAASAIGAQPPPRAVSLVVVGKTVITENAGHRVLSPGAVAIDGATILDVDTPQAIAAKYRAADTVNAPDDIVLPGLVNTHTHAPMVMYRGLADDLALMDWLNKYIFP